ncbi:MAG: tetratricopeptide repeat protein [Stackebrandtia sp.]
MTSPYGDLGGAPAYLARAELLFDLDRFDEAREELVGALATDPAHVPSLTLSALLELQVGRYEEALTAASAATAAEPTHEPAVIARAYALAYSRRPDEAIAVAEEMQARHPDSWWHNVHFALIVRDSRNGQPALDAAWAATRQAPEEARSHLALAAVASALGVEDLAERAAAAAERREPGVAELLLTDNLGPRLLRGSPHKPTTVRSAVRDDWTAAGDRPERPPLPHELRRALNRAGIVNIAVPLALALLGGTSSFGQILGVLAALGGGAGVFFIFRRLPQEIKENLRAAAAVDRLLGLGLAAAWAGPVLVAGFAFTGVPQLLAGCVIAGFGALAISRFHSWDGTWWSGGR